MFPEPPVIAYRNNPSLKQKLVRAQLKPIDETTQLGDTQPDSSVPQYTTQELPAEYPHTIFKRNPIRRCCHACALCP